MQMIYNIFIFLYGFALKAASLFNSKAKLWVNGRKNWVQKMQESIDENQPTFWVHCSSLGEFEQGKPVIEALKNQYPQHQFVLSFFSPSGYEVRKNYKGADYVFYLPLDTQKNAEKIIQVLKPELLVLVKYEYWYNLIQALHQHQIPVVVVSAIFRENQNFFKRNGKNWFAQKLGLIDHFFVQNEKSAELLHSVGINQVSIVGDTRFDRVKNLVNETFSDDKIVDFKKDHQLIVIGSSWPQDEKLYQHYIAQNGLPKNWKILIAPHEIDENSIQEIQKKFPEAIRYTQYKEHTNTQIMILDTIGMLSKVYAWADIVHIGGGFGAGIHNTLEAATYGNPIIIGPKYQKFQEALDQIENGNLFSVSNQIEFDQLFAKLLSDENLRKEMSEKSKSYVHQQKNATSIILSKIPEIISNRN